MTTEGTLPEDIEARASLQPVFKLFAVYEWVYALCPNRKLARITPAARFEVAMHSASQEKFSYTMNVARPTGGSITGRK